MKSVFLSLFLYGIIIIGTISPIFAYIPPTNAYDNITASNGTVAAQTYDGHITFQGLRGVQVFASNNSQTVYFNATLTNGTIITPITCSNNYQLHSVNSHGIFICALNNVTGGIMLDTMQNLTPAQAYIFKKNSTNFNFQFRGINFTGSLSGSNSSNLITIHGNIYQNNTGSNLGTSGIGIFSSMSGSVLQFLKLIGGQGISVTSNSTNGIISTNFKVNNQTCAVGYFVSAYDNKTGNYICTLDSDPFLTTAVLSINTNTNAAQIINGTLPITVVDTGNTHTIKCITCNTRTNQGTYNITQANNVNINSGGYQLNFLNGTGNPVRVQNSHSSNQVNITISSSGSGGVSSISVVNGNMTENATSGHILLNTGNNIDYLNKNQTITAIKTYTKVIQTSQNGSTTNTGVGTGALENNYAKSNTAFGQFTLSSQTAGGNNTAFGYLALAYSNNPGSNGLGQFNNAFGDEALHSGGGTEVNDAFGYQSLYSCTLCSTEESFGFQSLLNDIDGQQNSAFGNSVLDQLEHGQDNSVFGTSSFSQDVNGSGNIGLGEGSGNNYMGTESNNIIIGNGIGGVRHENNTLRISGIIVGKLTTDSINFTGKINGTTTSKKTSINIGTVSSYATSPRKGDIEIVGSTIKYQDNTNTTQTITPGSGSSVTNLNTFSGKINITRGSVTNMSQIINNTGTISYQLKNDIFLINGTAQTITKFFTANLLSASSFMVDPTDNTKKLGFSLGGMTTGITTTIRNNATTSQGINIPATIQTETFAIRPQINFTASSNKTGVSTTANMLGDGITLRPSVTGRIEVAVSGYITSSIAADGGIVQIRQITGSCPGNAAAVTGTALGSNMKITDAATTGRTPFSITVQTTGLSLGQKYCFELSQQATTGGTFTIFNVNWSAKEI